jgi:antitoxin Phd
MKRVWQLQEAKSKLSEVLEEALQNGPQVITRRGIEVAILLSSSEYRKLTASQKRLSAFFRESPLAGVELDLARDPSALREDFVP